MRLKLDGTPAKPGGWEIPAVRLTRNRKINAMKHEKWLRGEFKYFGGKHKGTLQKRVVIKDFKLYKEVRRLLGGHITWYGYGWDCPFCGKRLYRHIVDRAAMLSKKSRIYHLKQKCTHTPWFWQVHNLQQRAKNYKHVKIWWQIQKHLPREVTVTQFFEKLLTNTL